MAASQSVLVDANLLVALYNVSDKYHERAVQFTKTNKSRRVFPQIILPEVLYLLNQEGGLNRKVRFLKRA
jgi:predicted nucleic acid-binding protein